MTIVKRFDKITIDVYCLKLNFKQFKLKKFKKHILRRLIFSWNPY